MSSKTVILGVFGGVVGFMIGGPIGAAIGAGMGVSLGMATDPIRADVQTPGAPEIGQLVFTTANEGLPLPDLLGTTKCTGNILFYANSRIEKVEEEQEQPGGKGGGGGSTQTVVKEYKYYLTWAMGICLGPINKLYAIYSGDTVVWEGEQDIPGAGGEVTVTLENMGSMTLFFGTSDQAAPQAMTDLLDDATLSPAYRYQAYAFFNDCYIGNYNRVPVMKFVIRKNPYLPDISDAAILANIEDYQYNPSLAIWYILTEMAGFDPDTLDHDSFLFTAYRLYFEGRGVCILLKDQAEALTYIDSILSHIDGGLRWGVNGKMHIALVRYETQLDDLPLIDERIVLDDPVMERKSWLETVNEIKIQYSKLIIRESEEETPAPTLSLWRWSGLGYAVFVIGADTGNPPFTVQLSVEEDAWLFQRIVHSRIFHLPCTKYICSGAPEDRRIRVVDANDMASSPVDVDITIRQALVWDGDKSVAAGGSVAIGVSGGKVPYKFSTPSLGWWFDSDYTKKEIRVFEISYTMDEREVTIYHDGQFSDDAVVTVRDDCSQNVTGNITLT